MVQKFIKISSCLFTHKHRAASEKSGHVGCALVADWRRPFLLVVFAHDSRAFFEEPSTRMRNRLIWSNFDFFL